MSKNESKRLGSKYGAVELKNQKFFKGINWALLRNEIPPIIPRWQEKEMCLNFRNIKDDNDLDLESEVGISCLDSDPFSGFDSLKNVSQ